MQIEFDYLIPPDVTVGSDGSVDYGQAYSFHDNGQRALMSFTGWGMPQIEYVTQRGPFQHGQTALDYRLQPRVVQLVHRRVGGCREDYWDIRSDLLNFIRPNRGADGALSQSRLRKILPNGSVRDLFVVIDQGPKFSPRGSDWDEWSITETIRFVAYDPVVFDPATKSAVWSLSAQTQLVFPITFPIVFGGSIIYETLDVTYEGTWLTYPTITITGPLNGAIVENVSTNEKISIGYDIPSGRTLTINLDYGQKTVIDGLGINRIGSVTPDSDLATFHIAPRPEVMGGVNQLRVTGANASATTSVSVSWYNRYIGI